MGKTKHQLKRQFAFNTRSAFVAGFAATVALAMLFLTTLRRPRSIEWIPYSTSAISENKSEGKSSAVLYYARWTLSADPKGGLVTPVVSRSLSDAGFVTMQADLTDSSVERFRELKKLGFAAVPILVLYPTAGSPVGFDGGTPESEIVSTVERLSR